MPSTATTNVTIGAPLELIGPAAPAPAPDNDQPAFNSLLRSPPAPSAVPSATPPGPTSDEKSTPAYHTENLAERRDSSRIPSSTDGTTGDSPSDAPPQTPQDSAAKPSPAATETPTPKREAHKGKSPPADRKTQAAEPVVVESLAGLAAVAPAAAPPAAPDRGVEAQETKEVEPVEKAAVAKQGAPRPAATAQTAAAKPTANDAQAKSQAKTQDSEAKTVTPDTIHVATTAQPAAKSSTTEPAKGEPGPSATPPSAARVAAAGQSAAASSTTVPAKGESASNPSAAGAPTAIQVAAAVPPAAKSTTEPAKLSSRGPAKAESAPDPSNPSAIQVAAAAQPAVVQPATAQPADVQLAAVQSATRSSTTESAKGQKVDSGAAIKSTDAKSTDAKSTDAKSADARLADVKSANAKSLNVKALDEQAESSDDAPQGTAAATQEIPAPAHKPRQALSNENQPAPLLDPISTLTPSVDAGMATAANTPPLAVPVAVTPPTLDAGPSPKATSDTNQVTNIASPPRTRLPVELLVQAPAGPARRATVEIDAARLLARVARAFTAAQERDGEIRLRLSPPELGSLRLDVRVQDGAMVARLQTETDAARTAIIDNLPALRDRLSEQGVRIERFDVDLMQRQSGGMPDQPGNRQQPDLAAAQVSAIAPPRRQTAASSISAPSLPTIDSANGLNVVV